MRTLQVFLCALWVLLPGAAFAVCDINNPLKVENDCDLDGVTIGAGDCFDDPTLCPTSGNCDPVGGPYVFGCICNKRLGEIAKPGMTEICDGRDNDCDMLTDEAPSGAGKLVQACYTGAGGTQNVGVCRGGQQACTQTDPGPTHWVGQTGMPTWSTCGMCPSGTSCMAQVVPSTETCNNLDDNCNMSTDEMLTRACYSGPPATQNVGPCHGGTQTCNSGSFGTACPGEVLPAATETCNSIDDNCNGSTDEGNPGGGAACTVSAAQGVCRNGQIRCTAGALVCTQTVMPGTESCNGLDDNCNGTADEGNPGSGQACSIMSLQGACRTGSTTCQADGGLGCNQTVMPTMETCNNVDDNCNGQTDENLTRSCYTGAMGTQNVGLCRGGTQTCSAGSFGTSCPGQVVPTAEVCNNMDDNCNGQTDEGINGGSCTAGSAQGACRNGTLTCMNGMGTCAPAMPTAEVCDGIDNDCNGTVDDGIATVGNTCMTGQQGVCSAGTLRCNNQGGFAIRCVRNTAPSTEVCNGVDDDCNGRTDEVTQLCYTGPNNTQGVGICRGVQVGCAGNMFMACTMSTVGLDGGVQVFPGTETCNGVDDNCNGQTDEGFVGNMNCSTGLQGVCSVGREQCQGGSIVCVPNVQPNARAEDCNGQDDNCDGQVDNGVTPRRCFDGMAGTFGGTCPGPTCTPRGVCRAGTQTCDVNTATWNACGSGMPQTLPSMEICDGLDNNCNSSTDEGLITDVDMDSVRACGTCGALDAGLCDCNDMNSNIRPNRQEACNGVDDNCNGQTDEGTGPGGKLSQNCYSGMPPTTAGVGICVQGTQVCTAMSTNGMPVAASFGACMNEVVPLANELCNGRDDNCNGQTDEGFDVDNDGFRSCSACGLTMNCDCNDNDATIKPGAVEVCDDVDQNCDGRLDDVPTRICFGGPNVTPDTYSGTCPGPQCQPKGACRTGTQACTQSGMTAAWGTCMGQVLPTNLPTADETMCNMLDDDCDGVVDDGPFDQDMDGVRTCAGDCNDNPDGGALVKPGALEVCDGIDNNCDNVVDGTNTGCYTADAGRPGVGLCRAGMATCVNGMASGACMGQVGPVAETCNSMDDDCDGKIDEDFDRDGDGVSTCAGDCDDNDPLQKPGAAEICDCHDNNCNSMVDEGNVCVGAPCHDFDSDGFSNCQGDCDDSNASINPSRSEFVGNMKDDDCDGAVDENTDEDGDGVTTAQGDCDDHFASIRPNAVEVCDGFDNNCNGRVDEGFDMDGDFATTCGGDCDDNNRNKSPFKKEVCGNQLDDNCDGRVDEDADLDQDGVTTCQNDCNDFNALVHPATMSVPAAMEICDGQDNDCNGIADDGFDVDSDFITTCFGDCDDRNAMVHPGVPEIPGNMRDDNCNGVVDEGAADLDGDGFTPICGDCNDQDRNINPHSTEICDRLDNNCDSYVDSAPGKFDLCSVCFDADGDGQTNCDGDCNDTDPNIYRGAAEVCDGKDNDCDTEADLDPVTGRRVCMNDGGMDDDGGVVSDAGMSGDDAGVEANDGGVVGMEDGGSGMTQRPVVTTGCGCGAGGEGTALTVALLAFARTLRRRRLARVTPAAVASLVALLFMACPTTITVPLSGDGGGGMEADAGTDDGGAMNVGDGGASDAGFKPPVDMWPCPGLSPIEQVTATVPGTRHLFAYGRRFRLTTNAAAQLLLLDDGPNDVASFVARREIPADVDVNDPAALDTVATREIAALATLAGSPVIRDSSERFSRIITDDRTADAGVFDPDARTYTAAVTLEFASPTNSFSLRNRLVSALSGRSPDDLGALPLVAGAQAQDRALVYLMFRLAPEGLFVGVAVTTADHFRANQPTLGDLTNGSHLSQVNATFTYRCESRTAPAVKTDFIFVVDNSGSMREEQAGLAEAAQGLFDAFRASGLDFRIGVVTTDSDVLHGVGFTNDLDQYKADVKVGINGNTTEMGIEYGLRAIRRARAASDPAHKLRDDAGLVVVIVSDEENLGLKPLRDYINDYNAERAVVFSIVGPKPTGCTRVGKGSAVAGAQYIDLATATGGSSGSICSQNLSEVVEEVLFGALGASSRAELSRRPISGSLAVRTMMELPRTRSNGFDYDASGNVILFFGALPGQGSNFDAAYAYFTYLQ